VDILSYFSSSEFISFNTGEFERVFITLEHSSKYAFLKLYALNHLQKQLIASGTHVLAGYPTIIVLSVI